MKRLLPLVLCLAACGDNQNEDPSPATPPASPDACEPAPASDPLHWKRGMPLMNDLARALELDGRSFCAELGAFPCAELFGVALGGNDPFGATFYEPPKEPLHITSTTAERVILAACAKRADLDAEAAAPVVFTHVDLGASELDPGSRSVTEQVRELYRRLLGRDATDAEVAAVARLAAPLEGGERVSGIDFAKAACFAIGGTTEFLFF